MLNKYIANYSVVDDGTGKNVTRNKDFFSNSCYNTAIHSWFGQDPHFKQINLCIPKM